MESECSNKKNCWVPRRLCLCDDQQCPLRNEGRNVSCAIVSQETSVLVKQESGETSSELEVIPHVGQAFQSDDDAYLYYRNFARRTGFSVRRDRTLESKSLGIYRRDFVCHRAGFASSKKVEKELQRDRKSLRCRCKAKMLISKDIRDGNPVWKIIHLSNVHNHTMLKDNEVCFLPAYRDIPIEDQGKILSLHRGKCSVKLIMRALKLEKKVGPGHLPFIDKDVRNFIQLSKNIDRENDSSELLKLCKKMKDEDSEFSYDFTCNENQKLEHVAWSYGESIRAFKDFGDVVVFDTSYGLKAYQMPLGVWVGIDNHGKAIFFGCVLLRDEKASSFAWALQAFQSFMNGKYPQTILTNLDLGLIDVMSSQLPHAKHAFCTWHIFSKLSCWFALPLGTRYEAFKTEFDRLYSLDTVEEFESQWQEMVSHYELSLDQHIDKLYSYRVHWALPYIRDFFFAGITKTDPSDSINSFLKGFTVGQACLKDFIEKVGVTNNFRNQAEATRCKNHNGDIETYTPIEEHASNILTPYAFTLLRNEVAFSLQYTAIYCNSIV